jgi:outer membrane protein
MYSKRTGLAGLALLVTAGLAAAQTPAKVAIINIQGAIVATKDGEKARDAIRVKFEPRSKDLEARNQELQRMREQFQKGANTMSAEAREKLSREVDDKAKKYQWDAEDFQNELQQEEQKLVAEIGQRMVQIIDEHAKAIGLTLVLDVSTQTSPVLWAANGIDITREIVEQYDKKYPGGAAAPAAGAAKPAATPAAPAAKPAAPPAAAPKKPAAAK